jgi:hypothetical protein
MSYLVQFFSCRVPRDEEEALSYLEECFANESESGKPPADSLVQLHDALTAKFPCLSSFPDADAAIDQCPWSDGPLIENFVGKVGAVSFQTSRAEEVLPFILQQARLLKIVVFDVQSGEIYRPSSKQKPKAKEPPDPDAEHKQRTLFSLRAMASYGAISSEELAYWWARISGGVEVVNGDIYDRIKSDRQSADYPLDYPFKQQSAQ